MKLGHKGIVSGTSPESDTAEKIINRDKARQKRIRRKRRRDKFRRRIGMVAGAVASIILFAVVVFSIYQIFDYTNSYPERVPYTEFISDLDGGLVAMVYYDSSSEDFRYTLVTDEYESLSEEDRQDYTAPDEYWRITKNPSYADFRKELLERGTDVTLKSFTPLFLVILGGLLSAGFSLGLLVLMMVIMMRMMEPRKLSLEVTSSDVLFSDVIGHDEVIADLKLIVDLMKAPEKGDELGARLPKGMLFSGEPGTGKTLLAKAIAGECGVPFLYVSASSFIEMYAGLGAKHVRELFKKANRLSPCIIFIDELDAVGCARGGRTDSESRQTINALLTCMDGFDSKSGIFVIAATNDADSLDSALVRTGRFDRRVTVSPPRDWETRRKMFEHYLGGSSSDDLNIDSVSKQTIGFTGSDIAAIVNEAKLVALLHDCDRVETCHLEEAIDKHIFKGNRAEKERFNKDNEIIAYHEAGHAVMSYLLRVPIARASIIGSTSGVGGSVMHSERKSQFYTKSELENSVLSAFGGRCSEVIKFGDATTGASNDITQATGIIEKYVCGFGFADGVGLVDFYSLRDEFKAGSSRVADAVCNISSRLYNDAYSLLESNYDLVEALAEKLLELETLSGDAIVELLDCMRANTESKTES